MNELDEAWAEMIAGAIQNARASGREDVADFLALKRSNDLLRQTSIDWLFNSFIEIASEASRRNAAVTIEREDPHEFEFQSAKMAGSLIRIALGVRRMTIEAGWTRLPSHGFMRNQALAAARITHFGIPQAGHDLILVRNGETPVWSTIDGQHFNSEGLRRHFLIFLGD